MAGELEKQAWRILLVEDDEDDYILTRNMLRSEKYGQVALKWASSFKSGLAVLDDGRWDVVLVDHDLGEFTGVDFIREMQERGCRIPAIMLTGRGNYAVDVGAMKAGAADYLSKKEANASLLERAIRYAIERHQAREALLEAKGELEMRVQERTAEISRKNTTLEAEVALRRQMERELAEVQRRLLDRAESERHELAQELHDDPMQELYGLIYQLQHVKGKTEDREIQEEISACERRLKKAIHSLRTLAAELRPPTLAPFGLEKAIRSHAERFAEVHPDLAIDLDLMSDKQSLPERARVALFRIYQTALTNVVRHAQASQVEVRFLIDGKSAVLWVKDDGRGFQVPGRWFEFAHQGHLGLVGAAERAEALGGQLEVRSQPGAGTAIKVIIPLEETRD
jgi:signal transduction histidine kinase